MTYLEIVLLHQLLLPVEQECRAHVQMEQGEPVGLRQICVPQPDGAVQRQLACKQIVHPAK